MMKKFATIKEAAELTSLSARTIRRCIASGEIRNCRRLGKRVLIPVDQLDHIGKPIKTAQSLRGVTA